MAEPFVLTAQLMVKGPSAQQLNSAAASIQNRFKNIKANVALNVSSGARGRLTALNTTLEKTSALLRNIAADSRVAATAMGTLTKGTAQTSGNFNRVASSAKTTSKSISNVAKQTQVATNNMAEFGRISGLAVRRFLAFSIGAGAILGVVAGIKSGIRAAIDFEREMIRVQQVTGNTAEGIRGLTSEIRRLSTTFGTSSAELAAVSRTLSQAGLTARQTKTALEAITKSDLSPTFENMTQTTEGVIAAMRQFGIEADKIESKLGAINAVSGSFAVESGDIIAAIRRTGGAFRAAGGSIEELIALFTSVRSTTRESAETIATGFRTIFTRIQRPRTIKFLRELGIELQDSAGRFVGPLQAIQKLNAALSNLDTRDVRFARITEQLGGFRQVTKVIPLIKEFSTSQKALSVALSGGQSLAEDAATAQSALAVQLTKTREEFLKLFNAFVQSDVFKESATAALNLAQSLAKVFSQLGPIIKILAAPVGAKLLGSVASFLGPKGLSGNIFNFKQGSEATSAGTARSGQSQIVSANTRAIENNTRQESSSTKGSVVNSKSLNTLSSTLVKLNNTLEKTNIELSSITSGRGRRGSSAQRGATAAPAPFIPVPPTATPQQQKAQSSAIFQSGAATFKGVVPLGGPVLLSGATRTQNQPTVVKRGFYEKETTNIFSKVSGPTAKNVGVFPLGSPFTRTSDAPNIRLPGAVLPKTSGLNIPLPIVSGQQQVGLPSSQFVPLRQFKRQSGINKGLTPPPIGLRTLRRTQDSSNIGRGAFAGLTTGLFLGNLAQSMTEAGSATNKLAADITKAVITFEALRLAMGAVQSVGKGFSSFLLSLGSGKGTLGQRIGGAIGKRAKTIGAVAGVGIAATALVLLANSAKKSSEEMAKNAKNQKDLNAAIGKSRQARILSSAGYGAAGGAAIGSLFGPLGIAIGGAAGGIIGAIWGSTSSMEAEIKKLQKINRESRGQEAREEISDDLGRLLSGNVNIRGSREATNLESNLREQIRLFEQASLTGDREETIARSRAIKGVAPQLITLKEELIKSSKTIEDFTANGTAGAAIIETLAFTQKESILDVKNAIAGEIKAREENIAKQEEQNKSISEVTNTLTIFKQFNASLKDINAKLSAASGQIGVSSRLAGGQTAIGEFTGRPGFGDFARISDAGIQDLQQFNRALDQALGGFAGASDVGKSALSEVKDLALIIEAIPELLQETAQRASINAEQTSSIFSNLLEERFGDIVGKDTITRVDNILSRGIDNLLDAREGGGFGKFVSQAFSDPQALAESIGQEELTKIFQEIDEASRGILQSVKVLDSAINASIDNQISIQNRRLGLEKQGLADQQQLFNLRNRGPGQFGVSRIRDARNRSLSNLLGGTGVNPQDIEGIGEALRRVNSEIEELSLQRQDLIPGADDGEFKRVTDELKNLNIEASKYRTALETLKDVTNEASEIQKTLNTLEEQKKARFGIAERFAFGTEADQAKILQSIGDAILLSAGQVNLRDIGQGRRAEVRNLANQLSNTPSAAFGGQTGTQFRVGQTQRVLSQIQGGPFGVEQLFKKAFGENIDVTKLSPTQEKLVGELETLFNQRASAEAQFLANLEDRSFKIIDKIGDEIAGFPQLVASTLTQALVAGREREIRRTQAEIISIEEQRKGVSSATSFLSGRGIDLSNQGATRFAQLFSPDSTSLRQIESVQKRYAQIAELRTLRPGTIRSGAAQSEFGGVIFQSPSSPLTIGNNLVEEFNRIRNEIDASKTDAELQQSVLGQLDSVGKLFEQFGIRDVSGAKNIVAQEFTSGLGGSTEDIISKSINKIVEQEVKNVFADVETLATTGGIEGRGAFLRGVISDEQSVEQLKTIGNSLSKIDVGNVQELDSQFRLLTERVKLLNASLPSGAGTVAEARATGGNIFKKQGTDTVPAMLTPGEFVVRREAAQKNMGLLRAINSGNDSAEIRNGVQYARHGGMLAAVRRLAQEAIEEERLRRLQIDEDTRRRTSAIQRQGADTGGGGPFVFAPGGVDFARIQAGARAEQAARPQLERERLLAQLSPQERARRQRRLAFDAKLQRRREANERLQQQRRQAFVQRAPGLALEGEARQEYFRNRRQQEDAAARLRQLDRLDAVRNKRSSTQNNKLAELRERLGKLSPTDTVGRTRLQTQISNIERLQTQGDSAQFQQVTFGRGTVDEQIANIQNQLQAQSSQSFLPGSFRTQYGLAGAFQGGTSSRDIIRQTQNRRRLQDRLAALIRRRDGVTGGAQQQQNNVQLGQAATSSQVTSRGTIYARGYFNTLEGRRVQPEQFSMESTGSRAADISLMENFLEATGQMTPARQQQPQAGTTDFRQRRAYDGGSVVAGPKPTIQGRLDRIKKAGQRLQELKEQETDKKQLRTLNLLAARQYGYSTLTNRGREAVADLSEKFGFINGVGRYTPVSADSDARQKLRELHKQVIEGIFEDRTQPKRFHSGGLVPGAGEQPAILRGGEFVLSRPTVQALAKGGVVKGYQDGGSVSGSTGGTQSFEITLSSDSKSAIENMSRSIGEAAGNIRGAFAEIPTQLRESLSAFPAQLESSSQLINDAAMKFQESATVMQEIPTAITAALGESSVAFNESVGGLGTSIGELGATTETFGQGIGQLATIVADLGAATESMSGAATQIRDALAQEMNISVTHTIEPITVSVEGGGSTTQDGTAFEEMIMKVVGPEIDNLRDRIRDQGFGIA